MRGRKKITQGDIDSLEKLKRKAIHNQWYGIAGMLRDVQRNLVYKVDEDAVEDILDVVRRESLKKVCPNGHKYTASPSVDFCPRCIREKTNKQPKNN